MSSSDVTSCVPAISRNIFMSFLLVCPSMKVLIGSIPFSNASSALISPADKGLIASLYTVLSVGAIIKNVKNSASPTIIWFGGTVCVPIAALTKWSTIIILVKEVSIIRIDGANDITVSTRSICKTLAISLPSPVDIPILIRLFPEVLSVSAAITLYVSIVITAKNTPTPNDITANAFLCFPIHRNINFLSLPN